MKIKNKINQENDRKRKKNYIYIYKQLKERGPSSMYKRIEK
jgi:hypothetical protein